MYTHIEGVYVYHGGFSVEQSLCALSYRQAADNGHVSERRKMVWPAPQAVPEWGMPLVEEMVPGQHRWTPQLQEVPQGCPPAGLSVEATPTHRDFLDRGDVDLVSKSDRGTGSSSPFQKAGGFFHSCLSDRKPRMSASDFYVQILALQSRAYCFRSVQ